LCNIPNNIIKDPWFFEAFRCTASTLLFDITAEDEISSNGYIGNFKRKLQCNLKELGQEALFCEV
jgi:hypothetical protein